MSNGKLTKYEKARILGARALQISQGAPLLVKLSEKDLERINYSPIEIAKIELEKGVIPMDIKREMPKIIKEDSETKEISV
ncbi:DNA-directed RNA polymerase subunit K [Candidatus Woesearchaeota archaeon]|nr:DNA-directed RNA polymerase subunit K [Candidatus Woesearchaeota archaeon]